MRIHRVLDLFAGRKRRADVKRFLTPISHAKGSKLKMVELDILRSRKHDLSLAQRRSYYIQKARRGEFDAVLTSPPCGAFSRARRGKSCWSPPSASSALSLWFPLAHVLAAARG